MNKDTGTDCDNLTDPWGPAGCRDALHQVADLCRKGLSLDIHVGPDVSSFDSGRKSGGNIDVILSVSGKLTDNAVITLSMELVRGHENIRVSSGAFFKHLSEVGSRVRLCPPHEETSGEISLWVALDIKASPMSMTREMALIGEIKRINELAKTLQAELPEKSYDSRLTKLYKDFADFLRPVHALEAAETGDCTNLSRWTGEIMDFLSGSVNVAVSSPFSIENEYAMAALAGALRDAGDTLGVLTPPAVAVKGIPELAQKAPGRVVIAAMSISLGSNLYEMGKEVDALLAALSTIRRPVVFTGTLEQLQSVFHGGQGALNDPLFPVVCHAPEIHINALTLFAVKSAGRLAGGLSARDENELYEKTLSDIQCLSPAEQKRILPVIVERNVYIRTKGIKAPDSSAISFATRVAGLSETLAGLSPRPRVSRLPEVQERFTRILTSPDLLTFFQESLMAQDHALEQLISRLSMEALTRPGHQPLRYCAQGTPATGKSESAVLLAQRLGIPYIIIDAASMPDYHTAASQLLGSGRGIVMSYQAGRLEQAGKQNSGVVVEVSDMDHAVPSVRSMIADLFLQVLETGEAQSATGAMFSCSNIIFAFTMNLPDGLDETVRKGIGFNNTPSRVDVSRRVISEIKNMLSGAFLSRIGTPILFEPLDGYALSSIVERAIKRAVLSAAERLNLELMDLALDENLGSKVIASMKSNIVSFGARAILEHGRTLAA